MTNVTYNEDIPASGNNPSVDQPKMRVNTNAVNTLMNVDHYGFNDDNGGTHKQVTIPSTDPGDGDTVTGIAPGTASTKDDLSFTNDNATFLLNSIRAAGVFTTVATAAPVAVTLDMGFNVASVQKTGSVQHQITLSTNVTTTDTVIILLNTSNAGQIGWSFASNVLTLSGGGSAAGTKISFAVLQV